MKNSFKKLASLFLAMLMVAGMFPTAVFAADSVITTAADRTEAVIGDTVEVAFSINGNPGFTNVELTLDFDTDILKFTGLKINPDTESYDGRFGGGVTVANTDPKSEKYGFVTNARDTATSTDGKLFVAVFEVTGIGSTSVGANIILMENSGAGISPLPSVTPSAKINVSAPSEGMISLDKDELSLPVGQSYALSATVILGSGTGETITWASDNESVAAVDENGMVTAISVGEAVITVSSGSLSAYCTVTVKEAVPYLSSLYITEASFVNSDGTAFEYPMEPAFDGKTYHYTAVAQDNYTRAFAWATLSEAAPEGAVITAKWTDSSGSERTAEITSGKAVGTYLANAVSSGTEGNTVIFEVGTENDKLVYTVEIERSPSLSGLSASDENGEDIRFNEDFAVDTTEYSASTSSEYITVSAVPFDESYTVTYNGGESGIIALSEGENVIEIRVLNSFGYEKVYTLTVIRVSAPKIKFNVSPENALVFVTDKFSERVFPNENGEFELLAGEEYYCTVTAFGYIGKAATFVPEGDETITVNLEKAAETVFRKYESSWPSFGLNNENNIVIDRPTPLTKDETALYWANKIGEGYDSGAAGVPILVDDYLYVYAGKYIMKIDKMSGETLIKKTMSGGTSPYAICSLSYAEGLVFVGLNNGTVQAFSAETLDSVWIYRDPLKGQPNAQITYSDGYVYTGFWNSETKDASYVCLSITDENPDDDDEKKLATWRHLQAGGFYWAGAYISGDYLYIGTDDGESGYEEGFAHLLSINKHTGEVVEDITMPNTGDIRSSITYSDGKLYFTSKGGYFYEAEFDPETGDIGNLRWLELQNGGKGVPMSTSTPTVYNGRAYVGVSGEGQFVAYSGHCINVIDIESWSVAYRVPTQGYPQTSGTLTTAYEEESGYVYVYFFDNYTPGKLRVIADKPGMTEPIMAIEETTNGKTYTVGYSVFEPTGELAEYCICTPIIDKDGTLYFKNDSAHLFAVGSAVEYIEVTKNPDKMTYEPGEVFDPTGMQVIAYYYNGTERDITNYVTYSTEPLTEDDENFMIIYENVGSDEKPYAVIEITVGNGLVKLLPDSVSSTTKIRLTDTVKLDNSIDTPEVYFVDKPAGGSFYVGIFSDVEYDEISITANGYLKAQLLDFDPEKYRSVGETYSVYNRMTGTVAEENAAGLTYDRAKKLAEKLNNETRTTLYEVRCDQFVYVAKITVGQNYNTAYKSGTYKFTAIKNGVGYSSAVYTVVTDVSIFEYEYLKWSAANDRVEVSSENARGYSDYLSYKYGYGDGEYAPPLAEYPTVVSTTGFRAVAGKKLVLACGESVTVEIPEVSTIQGGINFIFKNTVGEFDSEKATVYSLTFFGKQPLESNYVIRWDLGRSYYQLREDFGIKLEENDVITFYITKDGKYFDEFTVDFMSDDISENIVLSLENEGGTSLGTYRITTERPSDADSSKDSADETNPNTGADIPFFG